MLQTEFEFSRAACMVDAVPNQEGEYMKKGKKAKTKKAKRVMSEQAIDRHWAAVWRARKELGLQ